MYLNNENRTALIEVAMASIQYGFDSGQPSPIDLSEFDKNLQNIRSCFVTLEIEKQLRGCIGNLQAHEPLVLNVAHNAFNAAFRDPRFQPLNHGEFDLLDIHISVIQPASKLTFASEADLLSQIRPKIDGLILKEGFYEATFLPSVWESLSDPNEFLKHLKMKAGLRPDHWSKDLQVFRYETESFGSRDLE